MHQCICKLAYIIATYYITFNNVSCTGIYIITMASGQKKIYIAKDGEILYGKQREEHLRDVSDEDEFEDNSEMYIKGGYILHGKEARKEKLADDVKDALKISGMNKWLDKLEKEAKEKNEKAKQHEESNDEDEITVAKVAENLFKVHKKLPKIQNPETLEVAKDVCQKQCDVEHSNSSADVVQNAASEIRKKLPSKVKSVADKGLKVTKNAWETGQGVVKTAKEAGKAIQDVLDGEIPEVDFSSNAEFTGDFKGHATPLQETSNSVRIGEAQLQLKGHLHGNTQFSGKVNGKKVTVDGEFDADLSANAELVGLDIQTGNDTKQGTTQKSAVETTINKDKMCKVKDTKESPTKKLVKVKTTFRGQANASAKGASIKTNTHRHDEPHTTEDTSDLEIITTAHVQATGVNVDINTTNKPQSSNKSSKKKNDSKLRMQGKASASATGVDVKVGNKLTAGEKSDAITLEARAHAEAKGCEVQIGNKIEKPKYKGASASATVQASGAAVRLGNISKSECDKSVSATAEARVAGAELNMGNISLDKGSSSGVAAVKEVKAGFTAFNVQAGMGGKTGVKFSTDVQFGNISLNLGPPALNFSPFAFNLGFGGGIKDNTGTAGKESKGGNAKGGGSGNGGHENTTTGNDNQSYATRHGGAVTGNNVSNAHTTAAGVNCSNANGYSSGGMFPTGNNSDYRMGGSGSHFTGNSNCSTSNSDAQYTQNAGNTLYSEANSHRKVRQNTTTGGGTGGNNEGFGSGPRGVYGLENSGDGSYIGGGLQNANHFDENGSVTHLGDNPHLTSQSACSSSSYDHTDMTGSTSDHTYSASGLHNYNYAGTDHTTNHYNDYGDTTSADLTGASYCYGHAGNKTMDSYPTSDSASTRMVGHHKTRKVNISHPTPSTDDQNTEQTTFYSCKPHRLPRKLNEGNKSQTGVTHSRSSQSHQTSNLHDGKYSGTGNSLLGGATHPSTQNDTQNKKKNTDMLKDDDLSQKLSLALSRSKTSSKKVDKSKTPTNRQELKQALTKKLIKVRKELEAEDGSKPSTASASSTDGDDTAEGKKRTPTSSKPTSTKEKSDATDQEDTDDVEEVPIPEEKRKPFGASNNIFTMDSIRTSTYKVQTSNKTLQKIGSNVMGFK